MTVICIGPLCIPIYSILPLLFLFLQRIWSRVQNKLGVDLETTQNDTSCSSCDGDQNQKIDAKEVEKTTILRHRAKMGKNEIVHVNDESHWTSCIEKSIQTHRPIVVDFTATWCQPCQTIAPFYESLCHQYPDVIFLKVDVDEMDELAGKCHVMAMPTFQVYKEGKKIDELQGADKSKLQRMISRHSL